MADIKISALTPAPSADVGNAFEIEFGGNSFKLTLTQIIALLNTGLVPAVNDVFADIAARDLAAATLQDNVIVEVTNAVADPKIIEPGTTAWYRYNGGTFQLITDRGTITASKGGTGIIGTGGALEINANNTLFNIREGKGYIVDNTVFPATVRLVQWPDILGITVTSLATRANTDVALSFDAAGNHTVLQQASYTNEELRNVIFLGGLDHSNNTNISTVFSIQIPSYAAELSVRDLAKAIGDIRLVGGLIEPNGANLSINRTAASFFSFGRNAINNPNDPHTTTLAEEILATFNYIRNDGAGGAIVSAERTTIDPGQYDDGDGTLAAVPPNDFTIQRVLMFSNTGNLFIQYGNETFDKMVDAINKVGAVVFEDLIGFTTTVELAYIIVKEGTTNLQNTDNAEIIPLDRSGRAAPIPQRVGLANSSGTVVKFDKPRKYGYPTAESTNITYDFTNAIDGTTQVMRYNAAAEPTFPASTEILLNNFAPSVNNYIYFVSINTAADGAAPVWEVHVTITPAT